MGSGSPVRRGSAPQVQDVAPKAAKITHWFIDQFSSLDEIKRKDENNPEIVAHVLRLVGRFSTFEMSERPGLWRTVDGLRRSGEIVFDESLGYPWTRVRFTNGKAVADIAGAEQVRSEQSERATSNPAVGERR